MRHPSSLRPYVSRAVLAVAVTVFTGCMGATSASASPDVVDSVGCVKPTVSGGLITKTFTMENTCQRWVDARMILAHHADTDCVSLPPGGIYSVTVAATASLTDVVAC
jgi:hypothetical protein